MVFLVDKRFLKGSFPLIGAMALAFFFGAASLGCFFLILFLYHLSFFRDPKPLPAQAHQALAPAEGTVVDISEVFEDKFLFQNSVKIGIFLSLFDAHVNRAPVEGRIAYMKYEAGKFLNAMKPEAARENECVWIGIENPSRKVLVRAISGAIARRICTDVAEKDHVTQGQKLGIICYGSRTELYIPKASFRLGVQVGQKIKVGQTILGEWHS